jgi:serine/threonine protein kinase
MNQIDTLIFWNNSFGVCMWEMAMRMEMELDEFEYFAFTPIHKIVSAKKMPLCPKNIPKGYGDIMKRCISLDPSSRPNFTEIRIQISQVGL